MNRKTAWLSMGFITFLAALAYLPYIHQIGYMFDDWYLMWAAKAEGIQAFHAIFAVDRPLRGYLMSAVYTLFGENVLWYNLSAFVFRVLGGFAFWWLLRLIWPNARSAALSSALLFVIYPGFLSQINGIDYQSQIVALTIAILSLILTLLAVEIPATGFKKLLLLAGAIVAGWVYLGLVDYFIGFELVRILLIFMLAVRNETDWKVRLQKTIFSWLPLAIIPVVFVFWRVFIFEGGRQATNPLAQLSVLIFSPVQTVLTWSFTLGNDILDVLAMAWVVPLLQIKDVFSIGKVVVGVGLGSVAVLACWLVINQLENAEDSWQKEALWFGSISLVACLIPVILSNRQVDFPYFSRYTLASSLGAAMLLSALIFMLPRDVWRHIMFFALIFISVFSHFGNSIQAAQHSAEMNDFWWQVAWRIPDLDRGTTLITRYPTAPLQEDYFVWGPANLIYSPIGMNDRYIEPALFAALPNGETAQNVLSDQPQQYDRRKNIVTYANFRNILLILQPAVNSCVRVVGGEYLDLSSEDEDIFRQMAPYSEANQIQLDQSSPDVPEIVFGEEPAHGWCFYYQKASLARQRGDWEEALSLGAEVRSMGLLPNDPIEWMPFLQAEALLGELEVIFEVAEKLDNPFIHQQLCDSLLDLDTLAPDRKSQIESRLCS